MTSRCNRTLITIPLHQGLGLHFSSYWQAEKPITGPSELPLIWGLSLSSALPPSLLFVSSSCPPSAYWSHHLASSASIHMEVMQLLISEWERSKLIPPLWRIAENPSILCDVNQAWKKRQKANSQAWKSARKTHRKAHWFPVHKWEPRGFWRASETVALMSAQPGAG